MFDIDYGPYDVIYFDPPYADTKGYDKAKFDFDRFHSLIDGLVGLREGRLCIGVQGSYRQFVEVLAVEKQMSQCDKLTKVVTERLFKGVVSLIYSKIILKARVLWRETQN